MGLFDGFFKNEETSAKRLNWIALTESNQLLTIISQSKIKPILLFKHSTRCGVSRMALKSFEREFDLPESVVDLYFLDLLKYRNISSEISEKFGVHHQSPQVLLVKDEQVIYNDSHYQISVDAIKKVISL
ncbi:bacillithiol system redox-active protein YtxJ [Lutibacter sp.]